MQGSAELLGAASEKLDAIFDVGDAVGVAELFDGDGFGGVEAVLVDPGLDTVKVYRDHVNGEAG